MNAQKESSKKTPRVHSSSLKPMKKCVMKMKVGLEKKQRTRKNAFDGRKKSRAEKLCYGYQPASGQ